MGTRGLVTGSVSQASLRVPVLYPSCTPSLGDHTPVCRPPPGLGPQVSLLRTRPHGAQTHCTSANLQLFPPPAPSIHIHTATAVPTLPLLNALPAQGAHHTPAWQSPTHAVLHQHEATLVAGKTLALKAARRVDTGALAAEVRGDATLVNICGERGAEAGGAMWAASQGTRQGGPCLLMEVWARGSPSADIRRHRPRGET